MVACLEWWFWVLANRIRSFRGRFRDYVSLLGGVVSLAGASWMIFERIAGGGVWWWLAAMGWAVVSALIEWPAVWAVLGPGSGHGRRGGRRGVRRRGGGRGFSWVGALVVSLVGAAVSVLVSGAVRGVVRGVWERRDALTEGFLREMVFSWQTAVWEGAAVWAGMTVALTAVDGVVVLGVRRWSGVRGGVKRGGWPIERVLGLLALANGASLAAGGWAAGMVG